MSELPKIAVVVFVASFFGGQPISTTRSIGM
jgi:hypothetical protein